MNYQFKGTGGTWYAGSNFEGEPAVLSRDRNEKITFGKTFIVEELGQDSNAEADAKLIAAAPNLLNTCIDLLEYMTTKFEGANTEQVDKLKNVIHQALGIN